MDNDLFDYIVSLLVRNANDSIEECRESKHDSFEEGRKQAYYEVLDTIKNQLIVAEYNLEDCGLDFNLEEKFCPNRDSLHSKKRASDIRHWRKEIKNDVKFFGIVKQPPFCSSPFRLRKGVPPCCFYSAKC